MNRSTISTKLILVGIYEGDLVTFQVVEDNQDPTQHRLRQVMLRQTHHAAIRVMRNRGSVVASGGADGRVVVANLLEGTEWSVTMPSEETVNALDFSACGRFLFVGGAERSVNYVDILKRAVICEKRNTHQGQVEAVRVWPPTGRIMITVGQDRSMRFWDLTKPKLSTATNGPLITAEFQNDRRFEGPITCLEFNASGNLLLAAGENFARLTSVSDGQVVRAIKLIGQKPCCAVWLSESLLAIGMCSGWVVLLQADTDLTPNWQRLHASGKLTAMAAVGENLATATNITVVTLWQLRGVQFHLLCKATVAGRATSLVMVEVAKKIVQEAEEEEASPVVSEADMNP